MRDRAPIAEAVQGTRFPCLEVFDSIYEDEKAGSPAERSFTGQDSSMSANASTLTKNIGFYEASIGKKAIMAVTGCILFLFVMGHLIGNLQIYLPAGEDGVYPIDHYAVILRSLGELLWVVRGVLLLCVILHITAGIQLWLANRTARTRKYAKSNWVEADFASRNMILTGLLAGAFIVYHLLDLTVGTAHAGSFEHLRVHDNMISGFASPGPVIVYLLAMIFLGLHLSHGIWSMFQSVGFNHPRYMPLIKKFALVATILIVLGNMSIPLAVHFNLIP